VAENSEAAILLASNDDGVLSRWREATAIATPGGPPLVARSRQELVARLDTACPGQYFLDLKLPGLKGLTGALGLIPRHPRSLCLAFSAIPFDEEGIQLLKAGARAYCNRYIAPHLLARIGELVAGGEIWLGASIMERLIRRIEELPTRGPKSPLGDLTEREREIAIRVSRGGSNKVIARDLGISDRTVKAHLTSVFAKTGTKDRLQLALLVKETL